MYIFSSIIYGRLLYLLCAFNIAFCYVSYPFAIYLNIFNLKYKKCLRSPSCLLIPLSQSRQLTCIRMRLIGSTVQSKYNVILVYWLPLVLSLTCLRILSINRSTTLLSRNLEVRKNRNPTHNKNNRAATSRC